MPKADKEDILFEDILPTSRFVAGQDYLRVTPHGVNFSTKASERYTKLKSIGIRVSLDRKTLEITTPGAFPITLRRAGSQRLSQTAHVNSVAVPQKATLGIYIHQGENRFVLKEETHG